MEFKKLLTGFLCVCTAVFMGLAIGILQVSEAFASDCEAIELEVVNDNLYLNDYLKVVFTTSLSTDKIGLGYDNESGSIDEIWMNHYSISGDTKVWEVEIKMEYIGRQKLVFWAGDGDIWCSARDTYIEVDEKRPLSDIPQNVRASSTEYTVTVRWDIVDGASSYYVLLNGSSKKADRNMYIFRDLDPDTEYTYAVRSNNSSGSSDYSTLESIVTEDTLGPDIPQNVRARWIADEITVLWDQVEDADDYTIKFNGESFDTEKTSYVFEDITDDRDYGYAVCANNELGSSRYTDTESIDKNDITNPDFPKDISINAIDGNVTLRWTEVYGADDYTVILNEDELETDRTLYILKDLKEGKEYEYAVRANNMGGSGDYSPLEKFKIDEDGELMQLKYQELSDWALEHVKSIDKNSLVTEELLDELIEEPEDTLSRAEFCEMLVQLYESYAEDNDTAVEYDPSTVKDFKDLESLKIRTKDSILKANALGIVNGVSDTEFNPDAAVTREMMAVMLRNTSRAMYGDDLESNTKDWMMGFEDSKLISFWAIDSVRFTNAFGILEGDGINFMPKNEATHEMGLTLLNRSFNIFLDLYSQ